MYCITLCNSSPKACSRISRNRYSVFFLFHTQHTFHFDCAPVVGWCRAISFFGPASAFSSGLKHFHLPSMSARLDHVPQQCTCVASFYTFCSFSMLYELFLPNVWTVSVLYPACSYSLFFLPFSALPTKLFFFFFVSWLRYPPISIHILSRASFPVRFLVFCRLLECPFQHISDRR